MAIATAIIAIGLAVWTAVGGERLGTHFEYAVAGVGNVIGKSLKSDTLHLCLSSLYRIGKG